MVAGPDAGGRRAQGGPLARGPARSEAAALGDGGGGVQSRLVGRRPDGVLHAGGQRVGARCGRGRRASADRRAPGARAEGPNGADGGEEVPPRSTAGAVRLHPTPGGRAAPARRLRHHRPQSGVAPGDRERGALRDLARRPLRACHRDRPSRRDRRRAAGHDAGLGDANGVRRDATDPHQGRRRAEPPAGRGDRRRDGEGDVGGTGHPKGLRGQRATGNGPGRRRVFTQWAARSRAHFEPGF